MNQSRLPSLSRLLCGGLILFLSAPLPALEPPTPEQLGQYKADGTLAERVAKARAIGNHRVNPELAARTKARLRIETAKAAGLPVNGPEFAPPPGWSGGLPSKGTPKVLVILVDFPDYAHESGDSVTEVNRKMFGAGDTARRPYESLNRYYQRASYSQLSIQGNVLGWYRATHNRSYYETAGNEALIMEAINYLDTQGSGHDFTQYDNNNDGKIEAFFLKWTGPDNGWANFWWAYQAGWWANPGYTVDGKHLGSYVWSWVHNQGYDGFTVYQPRVDIHETGHLLGLPDLYDYDDSVGPRGGVGGFDMMDANKGDHNCFSKFMLEWLTPTFITSGAQTLALNPSGSSQDCVLLMPGYAYTPGTLFDEFFMVQYRKRSLPNGAVCNDASLTTTDGFTIWHIDSTLAGDGFQYNNSSSAHKYIRLMEADGLEQIEAGGGGNVGDFYTAGKSFTNDTTPNSKDYAGTITHVAVKDLGTAGDTMSATLGVILTPQMTASTYNITYENCLLANNAVDPDETVTINFTLLNTGTMPTTNLVGTLEPSGGVTRPGSSGTFGASEPDGPPVSRPFTFTASGECGGTVTVTLLLQDGSTTFPPVTFSIPLGAPDGSGGYTCCYIPDGVGDFDGDGDVDQEDFGRFQACLNASNVVASEACQLGRLDPDLDVDQDDLTVFKRCHTQPGTIPDPSCRN